MTGKFLNLMSSLNYKEKKKGLDINSLQGTAF